MHTVKLLRWEYLAYNLGKSINIMMYSPLGDFQHRYMGNWDGNCDHFRRYRQLKSFQQRYRIKWGGEMCSG